MGKSRSHRFKAKTNNPTGIPSVKSLLESEATLNMDVKTESIESVIDKLRSSKAEDKECAATMIANMAEDPKFLMSLIEAGAIKIAAPHLVDRKPAIRHATAGCLRNVAVCGDHAVCEEMVKQDVMSSLVALLEYYKSPWESLMTATDKLDSKSQIFIEACTLLWNLCENSEKAVKIFNDKKLVEILLPCLNIKTYGVHISLTVAKCLYTVGDNNMKLIEVLREPAAQEQIGALMNLVPVDEEQALLRTLAAGIKLNSYFGKLNDCMSEVTSPILEVLASNFSESISPALDCLTKGILELKAIQNNKLREDGELVEKIAEVDKLNGKLLHMFSAKQISLEMLGNIFGDDLESEDDSWSSASDGDISEMDVDMGESSVGIVTMDEPASSLPPDVLSVFINGNLLGKISHQIVIPGKESLEIITKYSKAKDTLKGLNSLRCTALLCLNNMIQKLDVYSVGGSAKLLELWLHIANLLFKETDAANVEQVEAATHFMSSVLDRLSKTEDCASLFGSMAVSDVELLTNICQQSADSQVKVNVVRSLGRLACILTKLESQRDLVTLIAGYLLSIICSKEEQMWVIAEALDVTFDVFEADYTLDEVARTICLVEKLTQLVPHLKRRMKHERKMCAGHLPPVLSTANLNLANFIRHKNSLPKK